MVQQQQQGQRQQGSSSPSSEESSGIWPFWKVSPLLSISFIPRVDDSLEVGYLGIGVRELSDEYGLGCAVRMFCCKLISVMVSVSLKTSSISDDILDATELARELF